MPPSHRHLLVCAATALALLTAGCASGDDLVAPLGGTASATSAAPSTGSATSDPSTTSSGPADGAAPAAGRLNGFTPRSIRYRMFEIRLEEAELAAVDPATWADPTATRVPTETTSVFVKVTVENRLDFVSDFVAYDEVFLSLADGTLVGMDALGESTAVVDGGAATKGWFAFALPTGAGVDDAVLLFGEAGYRREVLPLTGPVPAPEFPKAVALASPGTIVHASGSDPQSFAVTIDDAYLADAVAFDRDGESIETDQALEGRRWLVVDVTVNLVSSGTPSAVFGYDAVRLAVDGEVISGAPQVSESLTVESGAPEHTVFVFDVPSTGDVELRWGDAAVAVPVAVS